MASLDRSDRPRRTQLRLTAQHRSLSLGLAGYVWDEAFAVVVLLSMEGQVLVRAGGLVVGHPGLRVGHEDGRGEMGRGDVGFGHAGVAGADHVGRVHGNKYIPKMDSIIYVPVPVRFPKSQECENTQRRPNLVLHFWSTSRLT